MISFRQALNSKDFVVTVELPLDPESTAASIVTDASSVADCVDGFLLTDNQYGQPHMSPASAAAILQREGLAPILQICSRNRNRIALIGELLGAKAAGIDSLMLVRGGVLPEGYSPRPTAVMDTDANELLATAKLIDENDRLGPPGEWLIAASAAVHRPADGVRPDKLIAKADAGAQLIIAQICHDPDVLQSYVEFLIEHQLLRRLSLIVSVAVVTSAEAAAWLARNRRGTVMPEAFMDTLVRSGDSEDAAIEELASLVARYAGMPGISGINFAAVTDISLIPRILAKAGKRP